MNTQSIHENLLEKLHNNKYQAHHVSFLSFLFPHSSLDQLESQLNQFCCPLLSQMFTEALQGQTVSIK